MEIDVLGPPYERHTIDLGTDDEGPVVATLVRRRADMWISPVRTVDLIWPTHTAG